MKIPLLLILYIFESGIVASWISLKSLFQTEKLTQSLFAVLSSCYPADFLYVQTSYKVKVVVVEGESAKPRKNVACNTFTVQMQLFILL